MERTAKTGVAGIQKPCGAEDGAIIPMARKIPESGASSFVAGPVRDHVLAKIDGRRAHHVESSWGARGQQQRKRCECSMSCHRYSHASRVRLGSKSGRPEVATGEPRNRIDG